MPTSDHALLGQLSSNSLPYRDPLAVIDWAALDVHGFWLPEPALSLYGLPEYEALAPEVKRRLSQYEFINVMQAGLVARAVVRATPVAAARGGLAPTLRVLESRGLKPRL